MANEAKCEGCGRAIVWAKSKNGKALPLDARAVTGHLYAVTEDHPEPIALTEVFGFPTTRGGKVYVSHFLTCPEAGRFSGRGA